MVSFLLIRKIKIAGESTQKITNAIAAGAQAFLFSEYKILAVFALATTGILYFLLGTPTTISFVLGAFFSGIAGYLGMKTATTANGRVAEKCETHVKEALRVAFNSGLVTGTAVVSLGLLGVTFLFWLFNDPAIIFGFGLGASSVALFARVGGGIYTKAADVGADLVGKIEKGIPEDDPRNPAVIADNVGDNVGDVAGMGADLFESYSDSLIAAMVIGASLGAVNVVFPLVIAAVGIIASILGGVLVTSLKTDGSIGSLSGNMNKGIFAASFLVVVLAYILVGYFGLEMGVFYSICIGLVTGILIGLSTEYFTSSSYKPTRLIAQAGKTGPATNIIQGLSTGMLSTIAPVILVSAAILGAYAFAGLYGIAIAAVGMLSTLGVTLAADSYGPVADNAAGIAEMAGLGEKTRQKAETLDAVGNTTAAIGKGFAIGSAALAALALFTSYMQVTGLTAIDISSPSVIAGLFVGSSLTFVFSALTMGAVGKAAIKMVEEVRRQFKSIKGLMSGKAEPDYKRCVDISTQAALREMMLPTFISIAAPLVVGLMFGVEALGGLLIGTLSTGFMLAVFMANAGGAWDNAKKYVEDNHLGGKGSDTHKATIVGDTVGDPFKDTSGPSLNILIKLMSIIALVFIPLFL